MAGSRHHENSCRECRPTSFRYASCSDRPERSAFVRRTDEGSFVVHQIPFLIRANAVDPVTSVRRTPPRTPTIRTFRILRAAGSRSHARACARRAPPKPKCFISVPTRPCRRTNDAHRLFGQFRSPYRRYGRARSSAGAASRVLATSNSRVRGTEERKRTTWSGGARAPIAKPSPPRRSITPYRTSPKRIESSRAAQ